MTNFQMSGPSTFFADNTGEKRMAFIALHGDEWTKEEHPLPIPKLLVVETSCEVTVSINLNKIIEYFIIKYLNNTY